MGMDPVLDGEVYEVTITLEGKIKQAAFDAFKAAVDAAVAAARLQTDPPGGGGGSPKIKIRQTRAVVRPK
jgi:hypothetical protein